MEAGEPGIQTPDALVLGGGGILGEAWMSGVLAGFHEAGGFDARECGCFIGTSAGSIVAAALAGGLAPGAAWGIFAGEPGPPPSGSGTAGGSDAGGSDDDRSPEDRSADRESDDPATPFRQALGAVADLGTSAVAPLASLAFSSTAAGGWCSARPGLRPCRSPPPYRRRVRSPACFARSAWTGAPTWTAGCGARPTWTWPRWKPGIACCA